MLVYCTPWIVSLLVQWTYAASGVELRLLRRNSATVPRLFLRRRDADLRTRDIRPRRRLRVRVCPGTPVMT